jgi:hypothetical protein
MVSLVILTRISRCCKKNVSVHTPLRFRRARGISPCMKTPERKTVVRVAGAWRLVDALDARAAGLPESTPERPTALHAIRDDGVELPRRLGMFHPRGLLDQSVWVEAPLGEAWTVAYRIVMQRGFPVVGEMRIFPHDEHEGRRPGEWRGEYLGSLAPAPDGGISARLLRQVQVGKHLRVLDQVLTQHGARLKELGIAVPADRRPPRPVKLRERVHDRDDLYARIAADYVATCKAGSRSPAADIARRWKLGTGPRGAAKVRDLLFKARRRGLLERITRGKLGGELTDKARELLRRG